MPNNSYVVPMGKVTQSPFYNIVIEEAKDSYLLDTNRKKYLDLRSGLWNVSLGYKQELYQRISSQFDSYLQKSLTFLDIHAYNHPLYNEYSNDLLHFINEKDASYNKVFFTNSGSEGTELATKIVRHLNNKDKKIITYDKSYHGTFFAGVSASGLDDKVTEDYQPKLEGFISIKTPQNRDHEEHVLNFIEENHQNISAFLFEPIIGSGGVYIFNKDFITKLHNTLKKFNILLIFDEVATGFYRTGNRFFFKELGVTPDILILSKSINNGILPFGAVVISNEIEVALKDKHIEHFSTQNGNLLGVLSAKVTLDYILENEICIINNVREIENIVINTLKMKNISYTGIGGMFSIPVNDHIKTIEIVKGLKDLGILVYHYMDNEDGNGLTLFPTLLIDTRAFSKAMKIIAKKVLV
ncbi:TPA: aminotransferase class III-fold pyridoxal phosphate-dependent enzyme [Bacillus wiedmannii]|uniref:aminotransferase class III-fold pyridoxal phosphate-dependent enzyme n=1 Tax=Bacillus wiedmannii TaxID=1890302 RepID=UPI000BF8D7E6|nr:aminotransferase class III-fold pyridoxal phosphate-dependent enzyme [Bacillus wiedmannii]PEP53973.1 aminotransferase [Bacillus wiedmannii]PGE32867.1 aminotransferase [Bacillus wiedmannii]PHA34091.1 aminotransferase [Bacillus wiedmannii]HDX9652460.1 aminotransferase class III-fold pyridoxal phosphate-dependent enzyme [Bacillus wiedmannii]